MTEHSIKTIAAPSVTCECGKILTLDDKYKGDWEEGLLDLHRAHKCHCTEQEEAERAEVEKEMRGVSE